jgi:hypothetical protein
VGLENWHFWHVWGSTGKTFLSFQHPAASTGATGMSRECSAGHRRQCVYPSCPYHIQNGTRHTETQADYVSIGEMATNCAAQQHALRVLQLIPVYDETCRIAKE